MTPQKRVRSGVEVTNDRKSSAGIMLKNEVFLRHEIPISREEALTLAICYSSVPRKGMYLAANSLDRTLFWAPRVSTKKSSLTRSCTKAFATQQFITDRAQQVASMGYVSGFSHSHGNSRSSNHMALAFPGEIRGKQ